MKIIDHKKYDYTSYSVDMSESLVFAESSSLSRCRLSPGQRSESHSHIEQETFVFLSGHGCVSNFQIKQQVVAGDIVSFDAYEAHVVINEGGEDLVFLSICCVKPEDHEDDRTPDTAAKEFIIFSTPPTPNGNLHLGHLSGPYLAADVLKRSLRQQGHHAKHITGRDDNQTYVELKAIQDGSDNLSTANLYAKEIQQTWQSFGIDIDYFIQPNSDAGYIPFVHKITDILHEKGFIYSSNQPALYNKSRYLHEAFVSGLCPHCNNTTDGNACEACGRPNQCTDIIDAKCKLSDDIQVGECTRLYFRLSSFAEQLLDYINSASMPSKVFNLAVLMIEKGLPDICISHPTEWGIKHAIKDHEEQIIYVWFEMAIGYLWGAANGQTRDTSHCSKSDNKSDNKHVDIAELKKIYSESTDIIHCYGFDNAYYHALLFPAIYMALGIKPPMKHIVNELLNLDGKKFSTSRNHLISGKEIIEKHDRDHIRFGLAYLRPDVICTNFTLQDYSNIVDTVFSKKLKLISLNHEKLKRKLNSKSVYTGAWTSQQRNFYNKVLENYGSAKINLSYESFQLSSAAKHIEIIIDDTYIFSESHSNLFTGKLSYNHLRTSVCLIEYAIRHIIYLLTPISPDISNKIPSYTGSRSSTSLLQDITVATSSVCEHEL